MDNKFSNIKRRVLYVVKEKGFSREPFFKEIGMTYGSFKGAAKDTPLNSDAIANILSLIPDLNAEWLLTGVGEIFVTKTTENVVEQNDHINDHINDHKPKLHETWSNDRPPLVELPYSGNERKIDPADMVAIPIVDISAAAGAGAFNSDHVEIDGTIAMPSWMVGRGTHNCVRLRGDSMAPTMQDGSYIISRLLDRSEWASIKNEYVYVLTDREGTTYVKRVQNRLHEQGVVVLTSDNPDKNAFPDKPLEEADLSNVWLVMWCLASKIPNAYGPYNSQMQELRDDMDDIKYFLERHFKEPIKRN